MVPAADRQCQQTWQAHAVVALARKLVVALWRYLTTGLVPAGAVLKAVKA
jgi:hypothetical protein